MDEIAQKVLQILKEDGAWELVENSAGTDAGYIKWKHLDSGLELSERFSFPVSKVYIQHGRAMHRFGFWEARIIKRAFHEMIRTKCDKKIKMVLGIKRE